MKCSKADSKASPSSAERRKLSRANLRAKASAEGMEISESERSLNSNSSHAYFASDSDSAASISLDKTTKSNSIDPDESVPLPPRKILKRYQTESYQYVLMRNRIEFLEATPQLPKKLTNMCLHNSMAHGIIFHYKRDYLFKNAIAELAKSHPTGYFAASVSAIDEINPDKRNHVWRRFIFDNTNSSCFSITYSDDQEFFHFLCVI